MIQEHTTCLSNLQGTQVKETGLSSVTFLVKRTYICQRSLLGSLTWFGKDNPTGHSKREKKKRQSEEEVESVPEDFSYLLLEDNIKEWTGTDLRAQAGQLKAGQAGKVLLQIYLYCPDSLSRLWD